MHRVLFSSATVEWPTPKGVYDSLHREFDFTLDPCPVDAAEDGLATLFTPWSGHRVFVNPPYCRQIGKWIERAPEADLAVYLIPARTDVQWFHRLVLPFAKEIRFIRGRLKFGDAKNGAPFPSMIVVFDNRTGIGDSTGEKGSSKRDTHLVGNGR